MAVIPPFIGIVLVNMEVDLKAFIENVKIGKD
jgi:hypothetical protein